MADFPSSLPGLEIGAELTQQQGFIRSPMDSGPTKQRKRFTAVSRYFSGTMLLTKAQKETLETFYQDTISYGADTFTYTDPVDNSTSVNARFMQPPSYSALVGGTDGVQLWRANVSIELLPN